MGKPVQAIVETAVEALGYELVDLEWAGRGLLRVFIDLRASDASTSPSLQADEAAALGQSYGAPAQPFAAPAQPSDPTVEPTRGAKPAGVALEDCERVSRQLTRVFEVEGVDYARLEVSSPGLDRPLRRPADFERFAGSQIALRLRQPIEGRRNFEGPLRVVGAGRYEIEFTGKDGPAVLTFEHDDVDRARLVPKVEF